MDKDKIKRVLKSYLTMNLVNINNISDIDVIMISINDEPNKIYFLVKIGISSLPTNSTRTLNEAIITSESLLEQNISEIQITKEGKVSLTKDKSSLSFFTTFLETVNYQFVRAGNDLNMTFYVQYNLADTNKVNESKLYGDPTDVVDYDLPEYLSDIIILSDLKSFNDVEKSMKEVHKRLVELEKGLEHGGQHQKAYKTGGIYSDKSRKYKDFETRQDSMDRDEEIKQEIERLRKSLDLED